MKFVEPSRFTDLDAATRKLVEIANATEAAQDGRLYTELVNCAFLKAGSTADQYCARPLAHAIASGCATNPGPMWTRLNAARWPDVRPSDNSSFAPLAADVRPHRTDRMGRSQIHVANILRGLIDRCRYICPMKKISACPGWLNLSEDRHSFIFVPDKAEIVRKISELSIGGLGSYSIANHLNRQNLPAFGPSPKWDHTTIDSMLRNRATVGEYQPKSWAGGRKKGIPVGDPVPGYYPAVIDEATFQAAQIARQRNLATGRGRKGLNITNIFTGLTTCAYCASPVKFHSTGNSKSLICAQVLCGTGCIRAAWSYRNFERSVLHFLTHPTLIESLKDEKRKTRLVELVRHVENLSTVDSYDARFGDRVHAEAGPLRVEACERGLESHSNLT